MLDTTTQAPEDVLWGGTEFSMPGSTFANFQPGGLGCPLWALDLSTYTLILQFNDLSLDVTANYQPLSPWGFGFSPYDAFDLSPILSDTSTVTEPVAASSPDAPSFGAPSGALDVSIRPAVTGDEIICHSLPIYDTLQKDRPVRRYATRRINVDTAHSQPSLLERFDDVMKIVRQLPPGHKPSNTHFTPFFTRIDGRYVCLLCPKALRNRTQMIQHISGGHGGNRPFGCSFCPHRSIRKADLQTHTKEKHESFKWYCSKCRKAYTNKRNMLRHKRTCKNSLDKLQPQECLQLRENSTPCIT